MIYDAVILLAFTLVGIGGFFLGYGWAAWIEAWHDGACTCRRHAWDPDCPVHGRGS